MEYICDHLNDFQLQDPAVLHNCYGSYFNLVDKHNRYWYEVNDSHSYKNWKTKYLFSVLRSSFLNSWTLSTSLKPIHWKEYRSIIAQYLMDVQNKK